MRTSEFDYDLPEHRIARHPTSERDGARLLVVERNGFSDSWVRDWASMVPPRALVVVNNTRVRKARVLGKRRGSGGSVELLLLERRPMKSEHEGGERWEALARPLRSLREGSWVDADGIQIQIGARLDDGKVEVSLHVDANTSVDARLEAIGHVPIPPYLGRDDDSSDRERYQTVFASRLGSVAAATAGLHLTENALAELEKRGITIGRATLHVGLGTFRPVSVDDLNEHPMHSESYEVDSTLALQIAEARARGGQVIAVGTTVVRALESAADSERPGLVLAQSERTRLLIQPGYRFKVVDALLTNFHQPRSTLLALVSAAIGLSRVKLAYAHALAHNYRFLSYGDAMWIPEFCR